MSSKWRAQSLLRTASSPCRSGPTGTSYPASLLAKWKVARGRRLAKVQEKVDSWGGPSAGKLRRVVTRLSLTPAWPYRHAASTLRLAMRPLLGDRPVASATRFVRQAVRARVHRRATSVGGPPIRGATWKRRGSAGPRRRVAAGQDGSHRNAPVAGHSHSRQRAAAVRALMVRKGSPVRVRQRALMKGLDLAPFRNPMVRGCVRCGVVGRFGPRTRSERLYGRGRAGADPTPRRVLALARLDAVISTARWAAAAQAD